nr:MAG TPA: hypothetical protein [Caudoviricetes sp.]
MIAFVYTKVQPLTPSTIIDKTVGILPSVLYVICR